jgi:hypothetical protein
MSTCNEHKGDLRGKHTSLQEKDLERKLARDGNLRNEIKENSGRSSSQFNCRSRAEFTVNLSVCGSQLGE